MKSCGFILLYFVFPPQQPPDEDLTSAVCDFLPALERRDGLSGSNSLYRMNLSDPFALSPLCSNNSTEFPSHSCPPPRAAADRTPSNKRTISGLSPSNLLAKKARRRTSDRLPLVQHNTDKTQKESNVSPILQQHNKTTVCVYWNMWLLLSYVDFVFTRSCTWWLRHCWDVFLLDQFICGRGCHWIWTQPDKNMRANI